MLELHVADFLVFVSVLLSGCGGRVILFQPDTGSLKSDTQISTILSVFMIAHYNMETLKSPQEPNTYTPWWMKRSNPAHGQNRAEVDVGNMCEDQGTVVEICREVPHTVDLRCLATEIIWKARVGFERGNVQDYHA